MPFSTEAAEPGMYSTVRWDIDRIVGELREAREAARSMVGSPQRRKKLPSLRALGQIVEGLTAALFPNRLGPPEFSDAGADYFVGNTLDTTLRELTIQVRRELALSGPRCDDSDHAHEHAVRIVREFADQLPKVRRLLDSDIEAAYHGDPAAHGVDVVLVCYPGIRATTHHRLAHELHKLGVPLVARILAELAHSSTGVDIHPGATIGSSFFIDHGTGVVIGESTVIGERVRLYQAVTLGAKRFEQDETGALVKGAPRHPIVEDDVVIYAGATVLGRITVGRGSIIGGNVWVTQDVAPGSVISQAKARTDIFQDGCGV